jgi:PAS domain S-box-containing protein
MSTRQKYSITRRLTLSLTVFIGIAIGFGSLFFPYLASKKGEADLVKEADDAIIHMARVLEGPLWDFDEKRLSMISETYRQGSHTTRLVVMDSSGKVLFSYVGKEESDAIHRTGPILHDSRLLGSLEISFSRREYRKSASQLFLATVTVGFIILFTVYFATGILVRKLLRQPFQGLSEVVAEYSKGNYAPAPNSLAPQEFLPFEDVLHKLGGEIHSQFLALQNLNVALEKRSEELASQIREREAAEEKVRRLATAVEQVPLDVIITNPDGNILYSNPNVTRTFGYVAEELLGQNLSIFNGGMDDPAFYKKLWDTLKSGQAWAGKIENRAKDGRNILHTTSISPIRDEKGNITAFVAIRRDITKEVEMETYLAQAQKMEAIGTLAGGIAHDFNNILSPILGYTELAKLQAKDDPKLSEYLDQVREAASRATELVRQILTFSRKAEQKKMPLRISSIVKEGLKLIRSSIPTSIEIRQEIATEASVLADPTQIHQIVMNLCTNAYHAMEKTGGLLAVSLKDTEIHEGNTLDEKLVPGRYVVLEVSDTGCGMDKETQKKIFEPYFTTKEVGKGTGLGLAVVLGIVKDHHGVINVYSELGRGARFRVYLPMSVDQTSVIVGKQEEITPTERHERILFVDDEARICTLVKRFLTQYGYVVDVCSNGRDALCVIEQDLMAYDLLITDMTMPGMNGKELALKVLALRPDLPVILCSGYSTLIDRDEASNIGIRAYLEKPVGINDLVGTIQEVLAS